MTTEILHIGGQDIRSCIACGGCAKPAAVFEDAVNAAAPKFAACDGLVVASPVYYARANPTLTAFFNAAVLQHLLRQDHEGGRGGGAHRRGGLSATFDELNKFFTISGMPVASSQYWNSIHGHLPGEAAQDAEGLQTMRTLARNMTFLDEEHRPGQRGVRPA